MGSGWGHASDAEPGDAGRRAFLTRSAALVASGVGLSACGSSQPEIPETQVIQMGVTSRPRMLDPRFATDALSSRINRLLYRQLIDFNDAFEPIPDLADWERLSPTHYRFTLQTFPRFHAYESTDATRLNAYDVAATYRSVLDPATGSPHRGALKHLQEVTALSESTVDFFLSESDPLFVGRLVLGILPAALLKRGHRFQDRPIGAGPCEFVSASEQKLVLRRADGVALVFRPVKDATVRVLKLRKGELDLVQNDLSPELATYCQNHPDLRVDWAAGTGFGYIGFNFSDERLAAPELREAIAMGIDRQAIVDAVFQGRAKLAGGLLVPQHWAGVKDLEQVTYQPDRARRHLATLRRRHPEWFDADGQLPLSFKTSSDATRIRLATVYQSQLKAIGIDLSVQSYDWGTFYNDIKQGRFQLYSLAWVGVKSPDIFEYVFHSQALPPKGANRGRYVDPLADELIDQAVAATDLRTQAQLYRRLQRHLQSTLAVMPLWYEDQYVVHRPEIKGYRLYADGRLDGLLKVTKTARVTDA
ncbi:ABC transporter substrate-binding protein [Hydrogenovibrio halophilus]|uniref:ABC transporter substrate-binding protein n=1 Tax=Hydrogenovibrio halophilus TaxID=373391 RepID=UPI0003705845|nr:ABC transporter substrate-binding protein [Hydrogenovibrio halophilus]